MDYFSFTVSNPSSGVWIDVDYGYTTPWGQVASSNDYNTRIDVYTGSGALVTNTATMFQDGDPHYGGSDSVINEPNVTLVRFGICN
jgi:hypothetical protein